LISEAWGLQCSCCSALTPVENGSKDVVADPDEDEDEEEDEEEHHEEEDQAGSEMQRSVPPPPPPPSNDRLLPPPEAPRQQQSVCRHFLRKGGCLYGDACKFSHGLPAEDASPAAAGDAEARRAWGGRRRVVRKSGKAGALRRFLLETFGEDTLRSGEGVLDIAGGNGELGFQLVNLNGIRTTVIDPRPLRVDRFVRKFQWGVYHDTAPLQRFNSEPAPSSSSSARAPGHLRAFLEEPLVDALRPEGGGQGRFAEVLLASFERALQVDWTTRGIETRAGDACDRDRGNVDADGGDTPDPAESSAASRAPPDVAEAERVLRGASCVVGLHPDQATGAALDLALALAVPCAVVPCCVYASEFPGRRLPSGAPVRSHEDLVAWLLAKDPRLREATLPFEGRNRVVYFRPDAPTDGQG